MKFPPIKKIITLIPGVGWFAVLSITGPRGEIIPGGEVDIVPLACWALMEEKKYPDDPEPFRRVVGIIAEDDGCLEPADEIDNLIRYIQEPEKRRLEFEPGKFRELLEKAKVKDD